MLQGSDVFEALRLYNIWPFSDRDEYGESGLQYSSLVGAIVQRLDSMWTRPSLTVARSVLSVSVADVSGCRPALLTLVAGLCRSFILSTSFSFLVAFLPGDHIHHLYQPTWTQ